MEDEKVHDMNMSAYDSDLPISNEIGRVAAPQSIVEVPVGPLGEKRSTKLLSQDILPIGIGTSAKRATSDPTEALSQLNRADLSLHTNDMARFTQVQPRVVCNNGAVSNCFPPVITVTQSTYRKVLK